jgi:multidrug efflux system outer membrane protein
MRPLVIVMILMPLLSYAMGPDYKRPAINTPQGWRIEEKDAAALADTKWWTQFNDPVLEGLIDTALKENYDLKLAAARVEEYVGRYWVGRSPLFPQIYASGAGGRQRISEWGATVLPDTFKNPSDFYQAGLSGSWELDIWGRLRRLNQAARADLISSEEGRGVSYPDTCHVRGECIHSPSRPG